MPHFLIKKEEIKENYIELIDNENLFHLVKVLRIKQNQKVKFIDSDRNIYYCKVIEADKKYLKAEIFKKEVSNRILEHNICLIQSILAPDAQSLLIANASQTGVKEIYPVISDNVSISINSLKDKVEKWNKVSIENFKQCERADIAKVKEISKLKEALLEFKKENILIFAEKFENKTLNKMIYKAPNAVVAAVSNIISRLE